MWLARLGGLAAMLSSLLDLQAPFLDRGALFLVGFATCVVVVIAERVVAAVEAS